jgi:hypothetical protein
LKNIESSKRDWKRARKEIKKHSGIIEWLKTPKPDDTSGHDWSLAMLCLEHGISTLFANWRYRLYVTKINTQKRMYLSLYNLQKA